MSNSHNCFADTCQILMIVLLIYCMQNSHDCCADKCQSQILRIVLLNMPNSHDCFADICQILTIVLLINAKFSQFFCWYMPNYQFFCWYIPNSHNCFADISKILTIVVLIYAQCCGAGAATFRVEPEPRAGATFFKAAPAASFWQATKESLVVVTNTGMT